MDERSILGQMKVNFREFLKLIVYYRYILYIIIGVTVISLVVYVLAVSPKYTAESTILPSSPTSKSMSFVKGLLGGGMGRGTIWKEGQISSYYFPQILKSRTLLKKLLKTEFSYSYKGKKHKKTLLEIYKTDITERGLRKLRGALDVESDFETGIITVRYTHKSPELAAKVVNKLISHLNWFNNYKYKTKAKGNLEYIKKRIEVIKADLRKAEKNLKQFKQENRNYNISSSPKLQLKLERLQRRKRVKSKIYETLMEKKAAEKLKVEKESPIVNVLSHASAPYYKSWPKRKLTVAGGFVVSFIFSVFLILILFVVRDEDDYKGIDIRRAHIYFYNDLKSLVGL